jgi:hypothetical protein
MFKCSQNLVNFGNFTHWSVPYLNLSLINTHVNMFLTKFKKPILFSLFASAIPLSYYYFSDHRPFTRVKKLFFPKSPEELDGIFKEAVKCYKQLQVEKSAKLLKKAADYGHAPSAVSLSLMYLNGEGVKQDLKLAFQYAKIAADLDDVEGLNNLGMMYDKGIFVKQDVQKAIQYISRAADKGYSISQYNLGKIYFEGREGGIDFLIFL